MFENGLYVLSFIFIWTSALGTPASSRQPAQAMTCSFSYIFAWIFLKDLEFPSENMPVGDPSGKHASHNLLLGVTSARSCALWPVTG